MRLPPSASGSTIWLQPLGLALPTQFVLNNAYARDGDIVIVAGTLIEGIGNECSDVDVYVITEKYRTSEEIDLSRHHRVLSLERDILRPDNEKAQQVLLIHTVVPGTSIKMDVEYKTFEELEILFGRIHEIFQYARENLILLTKRVSEREEVLIHRLLHCVPVKGAKRLENMVATLSVEEYLYIAYRWVASDFSVLLDIAGAFKANDLDRAVELARENAITQCSGYLRLKGNTNLRRKWVLRCLERTAGTEEIRASLLEIMYLKGIVTDGDKRAFVGKALDFVDRLFSLSIPLLEAHPGAPSGALALSLLRRDVQPAGVLEAYVEWELEYRSKAYLDTEPSTKHRIESFGC